MPGGLWHRLKKHLGFGVRSHSAARPRRRRLGIEQLEDRTLLSADPGLTLLTAAAPTFGNGRAVQFQAIESPDDVDLYKVTLAAGERLTVDLDAQSSGSALNGFVRIFDSLGNQIASNDDYDGRDPRLTFQAATAGDYFIGVSAVGNQAYNPADGTGTQLAETQGYYELLLTRLSSVTLAPDLVGAGFEVQQVAAVDDETLNINVRIENRGGAAAGAFTVQLFLSDDNRFGGTDTLLTQFVVAGGVAAGGAFSIALTPQLDSATTGNFFIGMVIDTTAAVNELNENNNRDTVRGADWDKLQVLFASAESEPNDDSLVPDPLGRGNLRMTGTLGAGEVDVYDYGPRNPGVVVLSFRSAAVDAHVALLRDDGTVLVESVARSNADNTDLIVQHLEPGNFLVRVTHLAGGGAYTLDTLFVATSAPLDPRGMPFVQYAVDGDFNGDGIGDLFVVRVGGNEAFTLLGLGNGSFQGIAQALQVGGTPDNGSFDVAAAADLNGDGRADLVLARSGSVSTWLARGNGQFDQVQSITTGGDPSAGIAVGDFNNDGILDIAVGQAGDVGPGRLFLHRGVGDGTFVIDTVGVEVAAGAASSVLGPIAAGDFTGDGFLDVFFGRGQILAGNGAGGFTQLADVEGGVQTIVTGDFDGDGFLDIAGTPLGFGGVPGVPLVGHIVILRGHGDGTFDQEFHVPLVVIPVQITMGDFNNDGRLDFATLNGGGNLSVVLNTSSAGELSFGEEARFDTGLGVSEGGLSITAVNLDDDGRTDLFVTSLRGPSALGGHLMRGLFGRGDGTFAAGTGNRVGAGPRSLASGDFNNDGRADLVNVNSGRNDLSILISRGDGSFEPEQPLFVGVLPEQVVIGDFNHDGRLDLAVLDPATNAPVVPPPPSRVTIFLGLGNGQFQRVDTVLEPTANPIGGVPAPMFAADLNGDGFTDLIVAKEVFLATGGGEFELLGTLVNNVFQATLLAGDIQAVGHFNGDNILDVVLDVAGVSTVYAGNDDGNGKGDGTFDAQGALSAVLAFNPIAQVLEPTSNLDLVLTGDFNNDQVEDLLVWVDNGGGSEGMVLFGDNAGGGVHAGTFTPSDDVLSTNFSPAGSVFAVADFDGDGLDDFVFTVADLLAFNGATVRLSRGDGTFFTSLALSLDPIATSVVAADVDGDGRPDLALTISSSQEVRVFLGVGRDDFGAAVFLATDQFHSPLPQATPVLADLDGDGTLDAAQVDQAGNILFRRGRPGEPGEFEAPELVNPDRPARDAAIVRTGAGLIIAAVDKNANTLGLYQHTNSFTRIGEVAAGSLPARIAAGDLDGDGDDDLAVINSGTNNLTIFFQTAAGVFTDGGNLQAGIGPFAVTITNLDGLGGNDILAVSHIAGEVAAFLNLGGGNFAPAQRYRAGDGPFDTIPPAPTARQAVRIFNVRSREGTSNLVLGLFDGDALLDVIASNSGVNSIGFLAGHGGGTLTNPTTFATGSRPTVLAAGDFDEDGDLDVAVLTENAAAVDIFLGDGLGGFTRVFTADAGNLPTGLSVAQLNDDNDDGVVDNLDHLDLLVGNQLGDLLLILGKGDGTFEPYERSGKSIPLAVLDIDGDGNDDFILGNESLDRVSVQLGTAGVPTEFQDRADGILAPGAVQIADLNGDTLDDLIVANTGANSVLVYLGLAGGGFGEKLTFFAGTSPTGVTIADVNGDNVLDLVVANAGSNDVSILLGEGTGAGWDLTPGPRLVVGAGPTTTKVGDFNGDNIVDILVANSQSDTVFELAGLGGGFFNDVTPIVFQTGPGPIDIGIGDFDGNGLGFVVSNFGANNFTFFSSFNPGGGVNFGFATVFGASSMVVGDFDTDGFDDLVVASDGLLSLILGEGGGFDLIGQVAGVLDPSALALANLTGDTLDLYVTNSGEEAVFTFSFDLNELGLVGGQVADVSGEEGSDLAALFTLLTLSGNDGSSEESTKLPEEGADLTDLLLGLGDSSQGQEGRTANWDTLALFEEFLKVVREKVREIAPDVEYQWQLVFKPALEDGFQTLTLGLRLLNSSFEALGWRGDEIMAALNETAGGLFAGTLDTTWVAGQTFYFQFFTGGAKMPTISQLLDPLRDLSERLPGYLVRPEGVTEAEAGVDAVLESWNEREGASGCEEISLLGAGLLTAAPAFSASVSKRRPRHGAQYGNRSSRGVLASS